jgi:hypothetical protein
LPVCSHLEYYVLGLLVDMPERAIRVLTEHGYSLDDSDAGAAVTINSPDYLQEMLRLLRSHGIDVQVGDAVDQIYRG